jgi:hypothetical protein
MAIPLHAQFATLDAARKAAERLLALGIERGSIQLITSGTRQETGSFAEGQASEDEAALTARVGSFDGENVHDQPKGSFAEGQASEDEATLTAHLGSFADVEPAHLVHHELHGRLTSAGLGADEVKRYQPARADRPARHGRRREARQLDPACHPGPPRHRRR